MRVMNKAIWPYQTSIDYKDIDHSDAMYNWCKEKASNWYLNGNTFCFSNEKEFLMFCLRWATQ